MQGITGLDTEQPVHAAVCVVDVCLLFYFLFFYSRDFAVLAFPRLFLLIEGTLMMKLWAWIRMLCWSVHFLLKHHLGTKLDTESPVRSGESYADLYDGLISLCCWLCWFIWAWNNNHLVKVQRSALFHVVTHIFPRAALVHHKLLWQLRFVTLAFSASHNHNTKLS